MQVTVCLVDWPEITFREQSGLLPDDFWDVGLEEGWIEAPPSWRNDSSIFYREVREAWGKVRHELSAENRDRTGSSFDLVFGYDPPYELEYSMDYWFLAVSPDTVSSMSENISELDLSNIQQVFEANYLELELDIADCQDELLPYLLQWKAAFDTAKRMRWGLLCHQG